MESRCLHSAISGNIAEPLHELLKIKMQNMSCKLGSACRTCSANQVLHPEHVLHAEHTLQNQNFSNGLKEQIMFCSMNLLCAEHILLYQSIFSQVLTSKYIQWIAKAEHVLQYKSMISKLSIELTEQSMFCSINSILCAVHTLHSPMD